MSWVWVSSKGLSQAYTSCPSSPQPPPTQAAATLITFYPPSLRHTDLFPVPWPVPITPASCLWIMYVHLLGMPLFPLLCSCLLLFFKAQPKCHLAYQLPQVSCAGRVFASLVVSAPFPFTVTFYQVILDIIYLSHLEGRILVCLSRSPNSVSCML